MISEKQIKEIKAHLEKAQNPVFFFDNDPDGLCSFLILRRFIERGSGVPIRSFPSLDVKYFRKVVEFNADYIFILDKPLVSKEFFEEVRQHNIPVVWIDHHKMDNLYVPEWVYYYNSLEKDYGEPVTHISYIVTKKPSDIWLSIVGCIYDRYTPIYYKTFKEKYFELSSDSDNPFDLYYRTEIGKISKMLSFSLKDSTSNVVSLMKFFYNVKEPYDVLNKNKDNESIHKRFGFIEKKYKKLLDKALKLIEKKPVFFFNYGGDLSLSSDLANEIYYLHPDKTIFVLYSSGSKINISGRGVNVREKVMKIINHFEGATAGGHRDAIGAKLRLDDLTKFKKEISEFF